MVSGGGGGVGDGGASCRFLIKSKAATTATMAMAMTTTTVSSGKPDDAVEAIDASVGLLLSSLPKSMESIRNE